MVFLQRRRRQRQQLLSFFCGGVVKENKAMAIAIVVFFDDGVAKKKKAMTSSIVTFFCGDVDFRPFFSHNLYFKTSTFQKLSINIEHFSIHYVLTFAIAL